MYGAWKFCSSPHVPPQLRRGKVQTAAILLPTFTRLQGVLEPDAGEHGKTRISEQIASLQRPPRNSGTASLTINSQLGVIVIAVFWLVLRLRGRLLRLLRSAWPGRKTRPQRQQSAPLSLQRLHDIVVLYTRYSTRHENSSQLHACFTGVSASPARLSRNRLSSCGSDAMMEPYRDTLSCSSKSGTATSFRFLGTCVAASESQCPAQPLHLV
jgi:hypothetical protein